MKSPEDIKLGLECCIPKYEDYRWKTCEPKCPYSADIGVECRIQLMADALAYIQQLEQREWELFSLLSSAWYGKGIYFMQDDGTVYSRESCEYLTFDQAIDEFAHTLTVNSEGGTKYVSV